MARIVAAGTEAKPAKPQPAKPNQQNMDDDQNIVPHDLATLQARLRTLVGPEVARPDAASDNLNRSLIETASGLLARTIKMLG